MELLTLAHRLSSLTVYRELLAEPPLAAALSLVQSLAEKDSVTALSSYADLLSHLYRSHHAGLGSWLSEYLLYSDAPYPAAVSLGTVSPSLESAASRDVESLTALAEFDFLPHLPQDAALPPLDLTPLLSFSQLTDHYRLHGSGQFARYRAFLWENGSLLPVERPDIPDPAHLLGYRRQREQVETNTRSLLAGNLVNNVLLFGDCGTGKSATVKSLLALPNAEDLRLIEIEKNSVAQLPRLIRSLAPLRQKFILFLDDLAFDEDDMTYSVLKTILEGGLESRPANVVIYATSNRRHLVRQTFSARAGDEVDREETIQEKTALADRFGLRIPYLGLTKSEYLELVSHLAAQASLTLTSEELTSQALRWDVRHPGRSPRTAHQFIASLQA